MTDRSRIGWYVRRLGRMSPAEIAWRVREQALRRAWARRQVRPGQIDCGCHCGCGCGCNVRSSGCPGNQFCELKLRVLGDRRFTSVLPTGAGDLVPAAARAAVITGADRILKGEWEMLGITRTDLAAPDWFFDPVTGRRSDPGRLAFRVNQRSEAETGNIKQVWEASRLQHLTLLACAYYLTGSKEYASRAASQLEDWWRANPFLSGVHWTSGIELGIRLVNFAWIRRLLDSWPGAASLFEDNDLFLWQLRWHQEYLAAFVSRGSSANNHVIAEAAGQLAASCAFGWFPESSGWRRSSLARLERSLRANTFGSGINRELATDYHGFVFELGVFAALEASAAGSPVSDGTWRLLCSMADGMAALVDSRCRPPRQGDSDEGRVVLLDAPEPNRWPALLSLGAGLFGELDWWPRTAPDVGATLTSALAGGTALAGDMRGIADRPAERPSRFPDAGITILRTEPGDSPEIWCRCDGGPHGFGSIAAHAHADALSVEVRYGGVDILADPGTYCYHGEPEWRSYFRSTIAHNTLEAGGRSQSSSGGPFLWTRHARARELGASDAKSGAPEEKWSAEHSGYAPARHRRTVRLDAAARTLVIADVIEGGSHEIRLAFHFGPDIDVELSLSGAEASLSLSSGVSGVSGVIGRLELPGGLIWTRHRGEAGPVLGWYSPNLGTRVPAWTLLGSGRADSARVFVSRLVFAGIVLNGAVLTGAASSGALSTGTGAPQTGVDR